MTRRPLLFLPILVLAITSGLAAEIAKVVAVVDGDTVKVQLASGVETVRLIGVDTPETVHPQKPVERFGKEASAFTHRMALDQVVRLEDDSDGTNRDKYGRLLRYVFLPDGRLLNAEIISQGYGHAYTQFPFTRMDEFRNLERVARENSRGLWGAPDPLAAPKAEVTTEAPADAATTVFVTQTGAKYHRAGCRSLAKSSIPIALKDAASRYGPCSICKPPTLAGVEAAPVVPKAVAPKAAEKNEQTVYATKTGTKYHRAGCRYLAKSQIPLSLKDAARYSPCSVCGPPVPSVTSDRAPSSKPPAVSGQCAAITQKGTRCKRNAAAGSSYCWQHAR